MKLGWKTISGALIWAVGTITSPEVMSMLPESIASIVQAIGGVLAALGLRHAIAKK